MSDGGMQVLDGTQLKGVDLSLPPSKLTGAELLDIAHSKLSSYFFGLSIPQNLNLSVLSRIGVTDINGFRSSEFDAEKADQLFRDYITAIADELKDNPVVVSVLDGSTIRLILEDEDDFAMLAENVFTDLDVEDKGKINKTQISNALENMGLDMGVPPLSEFPLLNDLLIKHGADGEGELGQAQFAQLLQSVLQDLEQELFKNNVVFIHKIQIVNGSKLRQLLAKENELNSIVEKALHEKSEANDGLGSSEIIRNFLERNAKDLGLPSIEADEAVAILYDDVFADVAAKEKEGVELDKEELVNLLKDVLEKFADLLESNPVYQDFA
ncbi:hypothetical protein TanjilG_24966 [Lupinus angustifolius]|uniref:EF-hand domain-containing protein n=1 Tax=Lupinus angustifolius TaxID=3871 RepID=A0A394DC90_LUPAN|nr:PREDICTED: uncharacterized protein LOC109339002 [Lupinus angustifolius]OIW20888.1 hypothetical protein TanjilG_24966 [Lupinus angustifolius]